jgi:alkyl hydroperoxide reductase subunit AhpF
MGSILDIYIQQSCPGCAQAQRLASLVQESLPELEVRIFDLTHPNIKKPSSVFAVPTYILDGVTLSLGNPNFKDLVSKIEERLFNT